METLPLESRVFACDFGYGMTLRDLDQISCQAQAAHTRGTLYLCWGAQDAHPFLPYPHLLSLTHATWEHQRSQVQLRTHSPCATTARARPIPFRKTHTEACRDVPRVADVRLYSIVDNAIAATEFKAIKAPLKPDERPENETANGLRVQDKGFLNTAVMQSRITYIDGDNGGASSLTDMCSRCCTNPE